MKLLIVGSRNITDYKKFKPWVGWYIQKHDVEDLCIISGGAHGVDTLARLFAESAGNTFIEITPEWDKFGKGAGMIRNKLLVSECDEALVFWDGKSRGTVNTISHLKKQKKPFTLIIVSQENMWSLKEEHTRFDVQQTSALEKIKEEENVDA